MSDVNKMTSGWWYGMMAMQNREKADDLSVALDRAGPKCDASFQMPAGQFYTDNPFWEGFTLLHYIVWRFNESALDKELATSYIQVILDRGCDKTLKNKAGKTAADMDEKKAFPMLR